jgi:hypothetical protein
LTTFDTSIERLDAARRANAGCAACDDRRLPVELAHSDSNSISL